MSGSTIPDPSSSDPERIQRELMAEAETELAKRRATEMKQRVSEERKSPKRPLDTDAETAPPSATLPIGGTSVYRMYHPASPISAVIVSAIMAALAIVVGSGIGLSLGYVPTAEDAHASVGALQDHPLGAMLRGIHYHGTNVLVYLCVTYLLHFLWSEFFRRPGQWIWWRALALCGLVFLFAFTGQLLPFDQSALHGTSIRHGYLAEIPVVGGMLHDLVTGGNELGTTGLLRHYAAHIVVLPALGAMILRRVWRDGRQALNSKISLSFHVVVIAATAVLVFFMATISSAPLGLAGTHSEPYAEARPEWYMLPLYQLLKLMPPGAPHLFALIGVPALLIASLLVLPWLETTAAKQARLRLPVRIAVLLGLAVAIGFGVWPLIEDMTANDGRGAGFFARHDVKDLMERLGRRNDALGNSKEEVPESAHDQARDIWMLAKELREPLRVAGAKEREKFPERPVMVSYHLQQDGQLDETRRKRWEKWIEELDAAAHRLYQATSEAERKKARGDIRTVCQNCHDSYDEFAPLDPKAKIVVEAPKEQPKDPPVNPKATPFFDEAKLKTLKPDDAPTKGKDLMRRMRSRFGELLQIAELRKGDKPPMRMAEQCFVDLRACSSAMPSQYAQYNDRAKAEEWKKFVQESDAALAELLKAAKGEDFKKKADALGKTCDGCHQLVEEDFRYADLFK